MRLEDNTSISRIAQDTHLLDGENLVSCSCPSSDDELDMHLATDLERVASLNEEELERQMSNIEQELTDIYTGKVSNWRKELLEKGSCQQYPYLGKRDLAFNVHLASFTDEQLDTVLSSIQEFFPEANVDIATKVLIPEASILIMRDVLGIPYQEVEKDVRNPQCNNIPSLKRGTRSTDLWWLSFGSEDDYLLQQLIIYVLGGGSTTPVLRHRVWNSGGTESPLL